MTLFDDNDKIYNMLRSLFRYNKLKEMNAPEILFEAENAVLLKRIQELSAAEIFLAVTSWEEFYKEQSVSDELQNHRLDADLDTYLRSVN